MPSPRGAIIEALCMANLSQATREMIEGRAALIAFNMQASTFIDDAAVRSIDNMAGFKERMLRARVAMGAARAAGVLVLFIAEIHRTQSDRHGAGNGRRRGRALP